MELETAGASVQAEDVIIIVLLWNHALVVDVDEFGQFSSLYVLLVQWMGTMTASYRWTGWRQDITGWSSRLQEIYSSF